MAGSITSLGVGSGLDLESLVQNLLSAEARPIQLLESRKGDIDLKISAFGQLQSALSTFQSSVTALTTDDAFRGIDASSSNADALSASASQSAVTGSYTIDVTQVAQRNKIGTQTIASSSDPIGTGQLAFTVGSENFTVDVTADNNSLEQIRDAINAETGNSSIQASIINIDGGSKLILTANESGLANQINFTVTDDDANDIDDLGLSRLVFGLSEIDQAQDAIFTVDGFTVTRASNEVTDVIQGVTLSIVDTGTADVTVSENLAVANGSIESLVSSYNTLISTINLQRDSALSGENTLINVESRIRDLFFKDYSTESSELGFLFQLGLSFDRDGILSFDNEIFTTAISDNTEDVKNIFTNADQGFGALLEDLVESYTEEDGIISSRTEGLGNEKSQIDEDIERIELRLENTEARLRAQFGALDALVSQLNSTSSFLTQQLANLPLSNNS